jgi:DNA-directed RNA polymerase subunit K/omega
MPAHEPKPEVSLPQLLLERSRDKYRLVPLAMRWALEVKRRDQNAAPIQDVMNQALHEILSGKVSLEEIEKLPPPVKMEEPKPVVEEIKPAPEEPEEDETGGGKKSKGEKAEKKKSDK